MTTIYAIGQDGYWQGETATIDAHAGAPPGWTRTAPPMLATGEFAVWSGEGWGVTTRSRLPDLVAQKAMRLATVRDLRQQVENAGITVEGLRVRTDVTSQTKIAGVLQLLANAPDLTEIDFEVQPGQWVTLDRDTLTAIGVAMGRHVQACFSRARELQQAIEAAPDLAALEAIVLVSGWPGAGAVAMR